MSRALQIDLRRRDLVIDGVIHSVPVPVWAQMHFLNDLNSRMAARAAALSEEVVALKAEIEALRPYPVHWTAQLKAEVVRRAKIGDAERRAVMVTFALSEDELRGWIERFDRFGLEGLKVGAVQRVRRGGRAG